MASCLHSLLSTEPSALGTQGSTSHPHCPQGDAGANPGPEGNAGGNATGPSGENYDPKTTKISVMLRVSDKMFECYVNDQYLSMFSIDKLGYALGEGSPWFFQRQNTTIEIDNLVIYAGIGEPDYAKTMANQTPLDAPDIVTTPGGDQPGGDVPGGDVPGSDTGNDDDGFFGGDDDEEEEATTTVAPTADSTTAAPKTDETTAAAEGGCGSSIGVGVLSILAVGTAACALKRKRK